MKETQEHNTDQVENVRQVQVEEQQVVVGSLMMKKGHKIFEVNRVTMEVKIAQMEQLPVNFADRKAIDFLQIRAN